MQITIPDELYEGFITFLNVNQASFTEEEIEQMSEVDIKVIKWIDDLLGEKKTKRFKTQDEYVKNIQENFKNQIGILETEIDARKKA